MSSYLADLPYADALLRLAANDERVVLLTQDLGRFHPFADAYPGRYIDLGIQESNLISVAAGLAHTGKVPFVLAMAPFIATRGYEQLLVDCAYNHKNVKVIGIFAGLAAGPWGATHHAISDIALMRTIPGMTVFSPADAPESGRALTAAAAREGAVYLRMAYSGPIRGYSAAFQPGLAVEVCDGHDLTFIAEGRAVRSCLAARELLAERGVQAGVINMHTIKPLDAAAVERAVSRTRFVVTVEEHSVIGGLGGAVAEAMADLGAGRLLRLGVRDRFTTEIGPHAELLELHGLDALGIASSAARFLEQSTPHKVQ